VTELRQLDHIALGVRDFAGRCDFFVKTLGFEVGRVGQRFSTGTQIAMLFDAARQTKVELIETQPPEGTGLLHLAFRVDNVDAAYLSLQAQGLQAVREPHDLGAAKARTALLCDETGLEIQIIQYAPDSPDL
jgi:catechol 2,3-dioxygenase-like lactoylglutathione lyase family enzyme